MVETSVVLVSFLTCDRKKLGTRGSRLNFLGVVEMRNDTRKIAEKRNQGMLFKIGSLLDAARRAGASPSACAGMRNLSTLLG